MGLLSLRHRARPRRRVCCRKVLPVEGVGDPRTRAPLSGFADSWTSTMNHSPSQAAWSAAPGPQRRFEGPMVRTVRPLAGGWTLRGADGLTVPAHAPGCVLPLLIEAGEIPPAAVAACGDEPARVAEQTWTYSRTITIGDDTGFDRRDLVFDGLDTLAVIRLDGEVVGTTENMHRRYRFDVTQRLGRGEHRLEVALAPARVETDRRARRHGPLPVNGSGADTHAYLRKMATSWGDRWAAVRLGAGIWRPVRLESWSTARLASVRPTPTVDDRDRGVLTVVVEVEPATAGTAIAGSTLRIAVDDPTGNGLVVASVAVDEIGPTTVELPVGPVERWWPHTLGDQPLYPVTVELVGANGDVLDGWTHRVGFRTVELDVSDDADGSGFTFVVNGLPIFARGVNWLPDHPFPCFADRARYQQRANELRDLGVDLIRVWGGGLYESDAFYDQCDESGVMVWQDFLFAGAAYPERLLADEVRAEAVDNVERLMPHPSLVMWNGNNEAFTGWFEGGWPGELDGRPWGEGYYLDLLPKIVADLDPHRAYWPGSPYAGSMARPTTDDDHGCRHLWDPWRDGDQSRYRDHVPRFVTELGWPAPPTATTTGRWGTGHRADPPPGDESARGRAATETDRLATGLAPYFELPENPGDWLWATQLNQARAVTTGIEHLRSHRGRCMGAVWWQFNDCWPGVSPSILDCDGRRKPAFHALRKAYRDRLVTIQPAAGRTAAVEPDGGELVVAMVNDRPEAWQGSLALSRRSADGTVCSAVTIAVDVAPWSVERVMVPASVSRPYDPRRELIVADVDSGRERTRGWWWFRPDRELHLGPAAASLEILPVTDPHHRTPAFRVQLTAHTLMRDLTVLADELHPCATADDGLISLLPGEQATLTVTGLAPGEVDRATVCTVLRSANRLIGRSRPADTRD
ncbi:MAG: glycoside hydrolase family 2 protein [Acidimicrobiales bacterium]